MNKDITTDEKPILDLQKEGVKLIKNTKGYNWEIKVNAQGDFGLTEADFNRLKTFDNFCVEHWGVQNE